MCAAKNPSAEPDDHQVFRVVADSYGKRLALVFGNHAADGQCPFYKALQCHHCDIGMGEGIAFDIETNRQRLEWYQAHFRHDWASLSHLVIYNSGSVLNPAEMPFEFLQDVLAMARRLASVQAISFDSRESFVTVQRILRIAEQLRDDQCIRIIIGIESSNDDIRNQVLQKRMSVDAIQRAFDRISSAAERIGRHRVGIDVNIVVGGPGTTSNTAVIDAANTASFALERSRVPVDFNIHPYYSSSRGLSHFPTHSRCSISVLFDAVRAIVIACQASGRQSRIFIGLNDEGHDTDRDGRLDDARRTAPLVQRFNVTQDIDALAVSVATLE